MWAHRFLAYNDLLHVTLMIHEPGRENPVRVSSPVQLSEIYPTVLSEALGSAFEIAGSESRDLVRLAAQGGQPRIVISEGAAWSQKDREIINKKYLSYLARSQVTAQDARFKYILSDDGMRELFDLNIDPGEQNNVVESYPEETDRLDLHVRSWLNSVPKYQSKPSDNNSNKMDSDLIKELRALGYLN
jgi:arylsulfatase A-like enzyme